MPTSQMQTHRGFQIRLTEETAVHGPGLSVHEEDNYGLLSSPPQVSLPMIVHPVRLYTELYDFSPFKLGSLRIQGNKILAIVVDVDQEPPCRCEWISEALDHVFKHAAKIRTPELSLPLLGHSYGGLQVNTSLELILRALLEYQPVLPPLIKLRMRPEHMAQTRQLLAAAGLTENKVYTLRS